MKVFVCNNVSCRNTVMWLLYFISVICVITLLLLIAKGTIYSEESLTRALR